MIQRQLSPYLAKAFTQFPVLTITGPRQSGKTTLARSCFPDLTYINLESPENREFASEDPIGFMNQIPHGAIIDEIQYVPQLTSYIQTIVDESKRNGVFVLTGSQQFNMLQSVSQSLAGRTAMVKLLPFSLGEIHGKYPELGMTVEDYFFRGFYPRLYDQKIDPQLGLNSYIETYIERDLRQLSQIQNLSMFRKFLKLCAGRIGQILNFSHLADDTGINHKTASEWISLLEASYIVFRLQPYYSNINKRLIKSPKLYFHDIGLASALLGMENPSQWKTHPLRGAIFENLIISETLKMRFNHGRDNNLSFFRDAKGHEVDLLFQVGDQYIPVEIKSGSTIQKDFFKGLDFFSQFIRESERKILVYNGNRHEGRSTALISNPFRFGEFLELR